MKLNKVPLLLLLLVIVIFLTVGLSSYIIKQHPPLSLNLSIECSEYIADGYDENGNYGSVGSGSEITLDGKLNYNSSTASELESVTAKITVYDAATELQLHDETLIQLNSKGISVFTKKLDFTEQVEMPSCTDYRYGIAFYSPEGKLIPHEGDLENSIKNLQKFLYTRPVY